MKALGISTMVNAINPNSIVIERTSFSKYVEAENTEPSVAKKIDDWKIDLWTRNIRRQFSKSIPTLHIYYLLYEFNILYLIFNFQFFVNLSYSRSSKKLRDSKNKKSKDLTIDISSA